MTSKVDIFHTLFPKGQLKLTIHAVVIPRSRSYENIALVIMKYGC
jgi:hypothetical protein